MTGGRVRVKLRETTKNVKIFEGTALLDADAALPRLLTTGRADAPAATATRNRLTRSRHLWSREDGFTMAGGRK